MMRRVLAFTSGMALVAGAFVLVAHAAIGI